MNYQKIEVYNPHSEARLVFVDEQIARFAEEIKPSVDNQINGTAIQDLIIDMLDTIALNYVHLHYTAKRNGSSIEKNGLEARLGINSTGVDEQIAIYFSIGYEAALSNWEVWTRWRLCQLFSPTAAQAKKPAYRPVDSEERNKIAKWGIDWMTYVSKGFNKIDDAKLERAFRYNHAELLNSDYLALSLCPVVDYDPCQLDPKKENIMLWGYTREIYATGIHTNGDDPHAEKWNMSTPLGQEVTIAPARIKRLVLSNGANDAYSVLRWFWDKYHEECRQHNKAPKEFFALSRFFNYCDSL